MSDNTHIAYNAKGDAISFVGRDAVDTYRAAMLKTGIALHKRSGMVLTRGFTITKMLAAATAITGKRYKRGDHDKACADLGIWIAEMKAAIPSITV